MAGELPALWQRIVRESLWGTRGIAKAGGIGLPLAALLSRPDFIPTRAPADALLLFASAACFALFGTLVNDLADKATDYDAGKQRWIQSVPSLVGSVIVLVLVALGTGMSLFSPVPWKSATVYVSAVLLASAYSVPPLRLKERGAWGGLCFAFCVTLCYVVFPWSWFGGPWGVPVLVGLALFLVHWVNLQFHQILDYGKDREQGQGTYVARVGLDRARRSLRFAFWLATAAMFIVLIWLAFGLGAKWEAVTAVVVVIGAVPYLRRGKAAGELVQELAPAYLALTFALWRIVPFLLFARLSLRVPALWGLTCLTSIVLLHDALVYRNYRYS